VIAGDIDPFCEAVVALNAEANDAAVAFRQDDFTAAPFPEGFDVVLAGDVFYDAAMTARLVPWFADAVRKGCRVLAGDPGRSYLPRERLRSLAAYEVPVTRALEDSEVKRTTVWEFTG
jgi:predicted nicotinamide N-methyase